MSVEYTESFKALLLEHRVAMLTQHPRYVLAAFEQDFKIAQDEFSCFCSRSKDTVILLQLGFEHETEEPAKQLAKVVNDFLSDVGNNTRVIVLCNCENECQSLLAHKVETVLVNHNSFLDERRYRPLFGKQQYDAVYLARLTPFKRHGLIPVELTPKVLFLGAGVRATERAYADSIHRLYSNATWIPSFSGARVSEYLAQAKCGLALSASEGACFASSEYFLCGLPVVDTPALGGRSAVYPEEYVKFVDATPQAIADGIAYWRDHRPDPQKVRASWLEKVEPHRNTFQKLMLELTGIKVRPPHKLGIRTPHPGNAYSIGIQMYLWLRSIFSVF